MSDGDTALEVARKVQAYLRGAQFTYSLELADQAADGDLSDEPLARFLETKRGYCVQFASAMVMLSRAAGIPARMAVGFLPGSIDGDDRVVRISDAHAWPELYFDRIGWLRFEPTPSGTQNTIAPSYSLPPTTPGGDTPATNTATGGGTSTATRPADRNDPGAVLNRAGEVSSSTVIDIFDLDNGGRDAVGNQSGGIANQ